MDDSETLICLSSKVIKMQFSSVPLHGGQFYKVSISSNQALVFMNLLTIIIQILSWQQHVPFCAVGEKFKSLSSLPHPPFSHFVFATLNVFHCYNQSLEKFLLPTIYPPIHPPLFSFCKHFCFVLNTLSH